MNKKVFGKIGENIAEHYLESKEYEIVCKNYYTKKGEIDVIAKKDKKLFFVEVKTRSNFNYGMPSEAVNYKKIKHMKTAAKIFLSLNKKYWKYEFYFDVIEIVFKNGKCLINHIKEII